MKRDLIDVAKYLAFLDEQLEGTNIRSVAQLARIIYDENEDGKKQYLRNVRKGAPPSMELIEKTCIAFELPADYFTLQIGKEAKPTELEELRSRLEALEQKTELVMEQVNKLNSNLAGISTEALKEFIETVKAALLRK